MKRLTYLVALALMLGLLAAGCAKKAVVSPAEEAVQEEEMVVEEEVVEEEIAKEEVYEEVVAPEKVSIEDIYFDFDRYDIKRESRPMLMRLANLLMERDGRVLIEGHCDARGTNQYNLALGDRRAAAAKDFLVASGVSPNTIEMVSYGEEKPQCTRQTESCWAKNRRAHFVVSDID